MTLKKTKYMLVGFNAKKNKYNILYTSANFIFLYI